MKAIAEYFRDLAADDRYFGAEPPTPDAAMLHQIAEREMKRRVEAKIQDNGVILRATERQDPTAPTPQTTLAVPTRAKVSAPTLFKDQYSGADAPAVAPADTTISDSVAAKLSRIRSAMVESRASAPTTRTSTATPAALASSEAEENEAALADAKAQAEADALARAKAEAEAQAEADALARAKAEAEAQAEADALAQAKAEAEAQAEADALAQTKGETEAQAEADALAQAKAEAEAQAEADALARAKAEAEAEAQAEADALAQAKAEAEAQAEADALAEAEAQAEADALAQAKAEADDALLASLSGAFDDENVTADGRFDDEEDVPNPAPLWATPGDGDDTLMASLAAALAEPELPTQPAPAHTADIDSENTGSDENLFDDDPATDDIEDDDFAELSALEPSDRETTAAKDTATTPTAEASTAPQAADVNPILQRARARVVKIRRADTAAASPQPNADATAPNGSANAGALSPEAEADLMRELADVQAEQQNAPEHKPASEQTVLRQADTAADVTDADSAIAPVRPQRPESLRRRADGLSPTEDDASVKRLLDQTNTELQGTENRRRLSAIAHLKAAVAATVADRASGGDQGPTEEMRMDPYRSDLERAVRTRSATSMQDRSAPLVLVSEQRIDTPRAKPTEAPSHITPVRPRRVTARHVTKEEEDAEFEALRAALEDPIDSLTATTATKAETRTILRGTSSFADYADQLGAESLSSLLEAAVAYAAQIEGRTEVTRPQMVEYVVTVQPAVENDRELLLRSFGSLLRDGRIEKASRGHFALGHSSAMHVDARKAAKA